ncbi:MAG: hypothetical protein WBG90_15660 [Saonia sp.]
MANKKLHSYRCQHLYTPKEFGGGRIVEKHLNNAINLAPQEKRNFFAPSWGRIESYLLLMDYYDQKDDSEKVMKIREAFKNEYPQSEFDLFQIN